MTPVECDKHVDVIGAHLTRHHAKRNGKPMAQPGDDHTWGTDGVTWDNPLTAQMEAEEAEMDTLGGAVDAVGTNLLAALRSHAAGSALMGKVEAFLAGRAKQLAFEAFMELQAEFLQWLFAAGMSPLDVVKRLFAFTKMRRPDLLADMGFRDLGVLLGEKGATLQARCRVLFGDAPAGWKKPATAVEKMRVAQRKSQAGRPNRRGGKSILQSTKKTTKS